MEPERSLEEGSAEREHNRDHLPKMLFSPGELVLVVWRSTVIEGDL